MFKGEKTMKNNRLLALFLAPACLIGLVGCNYPETKEVIPDTPIVIGDEPALESSEEYKTFWDTDTDLKISITMSQAAADFINNYQYDHDDSTYFDYYVPCNFHLVMKGDVYDFEDAGIRQKGNMSRRHMLVGGNLSLDSLVHYKITFKETFDGDEYTNIPELQQFKKTWEDSNARKERKNRTLFDMEKIDIKWNRNNDATRAKQSYALRIFRGNGVLAGNDTLAETTIGIEGKEPITTTYEYLECIDSVFIKRHFDLEKADGDLYKCCYTNRGQANMKNNISIGNQVGVEDNTTNYHPVYDLKTNKKKNTTHTNLFNLFSVINNDSLSATAWKAAIEEVMDMKSFMMYESIAFLMGNFDDLRNNGNNYYLYFASTTNMCYVIPYDFDRCLGAGCEGRKDYMTDFSAESTKMQCNGDWQNNSLYWRTVCSNASHSSAARVEEYRAMYQKNIEDLLNNKIICTETFTCYVLSFPLEYRGEYDGAGNDNISFDEYLTKKIAAIKKNNTSYKIDV